jgi:BTB/POZ domain-containing adapter for CUL3-mediated RhoA degradation protein
MLMKNIELFDKLSIRLHNRILFIKDVTGSEEICCWSFYGNGQKMAEVCCTSIVYATERKQNKVSEKRKKKFRNSNLSVFHLRLNFLKQEFMKKH